MHPVTIETQMMIRKPVEVVFEAFVNPSVTTRFWFTRSTGYLEKGTTVTWYWDMYGVSTNVYTSEIIPLKLISTKWGDPATTVDYEFSSLSDSTTYVTIKNYGFTQTCEELVPVIIDNTGGFTTVLDGLKAYLEYGIELNLVADKFPQIKHK